MVVVRRKWRKNKLVSGVDWETLMLKLWTPGADQCWTKQTQLTKRVSKLITRNEPLYTFYLVILLTFINYNFIVYTMTRTLYELDISNWSEGFGVHFNEPIL